MYVMRLRAAIGPALVLAIASGACTTAPGASPSHSATRGPAAATTVPPAITRPPATASPEPTTPPGALSETFTSNVHGISIAYPKGWVPRAATEAWPAGEIVMQGSEYGDIIEDGSTGDTAFIAIASQTLEDGPAAFQVWSTNLLAIEDCAPTKPVTVDGVVGVLGNGCPMALFKVDGRGYFIWLYRLDDEREWFRKVLATVEFHPEDAVDTLP